MSFKNPSLPLFYLSSLKEKRKKNKFLKATTPEPAQIKEEGGMNGSLACE